MTEENFFTLSWWVGLAVGAIIGGIIEIFIYEFLPDQIKETAKYYRRKLGKMIRNKRIDVELIVKTYNVSERKLDIQTTLGTLQSGFSNYNPATRQDALIFDVLVGREAFHTSVNVIPTIIEDEEVIDAIECRITHECHYNSFASDVRGLREAYIKIEDVIRENTADFMDTISLVCKLNSLYELTGVLSDVNIGTLHSSLDEGKIKFELDRNILTVYSDEINNELLNFMRKMVTVYF